MAEAARRWPSTVIATALRISAISAGLYLDPNCPQPETGPLGDGIVEAGADYEEVRESVIQTLYAVRDPETGQCPALGVGQTRAVTFTYHVIVVVTRIDIGNQFSGVYFQGNGGVEKPGTVDMNC